MNKSKIEKRLPEPQPQKEQKADGTSVSPAIAKPHVVRSPKSVSDVVKLENKVKVYEWFYEGLESLIKSTNIALNSKEGDTLYLANIKIDGGVNTNTKKEKGSPRSSLNRLNK